MTQCELCGKAMRTTQGLRGHKTFVHGLHANRSKPAATVTRDQRVDDTSGALESKKNGASECGDRLEKLTSENLHNIKSLAELNRTVSYLQSQIASLATHNEFQHIVARVELLSKRVKQHDQWFNPRGIDEVILDLFGGPIASIERYLGSHRLDDKAVGKKLRLKPDS